MSPAPILVTLAGDGTFRAPDAARAERLDLPADPPLAALMRLRALLGDDLDAQIATRLPLPAALGTDPTDHLLPATLALLSGATGDLAPYGWRIGPGLGRAWAHAQELHARMLDAARIGLLGYEGPLQSTVLGPATLAAATYLATGERTLSDPGAVRDLPLLLAEGLAEHLALLSERVPGAEHHLLVREDAVAAVVGGTVPTPPGRRHYDPVAPTLVAERWQSLLHALDGAGLPAERITLGVGADPRLLAGARTAGARRFALAPARLPGLDGAGRRFWEALAEAHDAGCGIELVVDPRPGGGMERELGAVLRIWRELGHGEHEAAGFTLIGHTGASHLVHAGRVDPSAAPAATDLLDEDAVVALLRAAPTWAERVAD